jgi:hypothetical protein
LTPPHLLCQLYNYPWRSHQNKITTLIKVAARGKLLDEPSIDRRLGRKVEVGKPLHHRDLGEEHIEFDRFAVSFLKFGLQKVTEVMAIAPLARGGLLSGGTELAQRHV